MVNKVKHIDPVTSLTNPLDSADSLLKPRRIPRQVYINECPERLKIQTFAGGIRGHYKGNGVHFWVDWRMMLPPRLIQMVKILSLFAGIYRPAN